MKPALLLIDLQNDFLDSRGLLPSPVLLVRRAAALLDGCRRRAVPVIHVWTTVRREDDRRLPHWRRDNRWICVAGERGHSTPLTPLAGEIIIHKSGFNAFHAADLQAALEDLHCDEVILAGLHLHACVRSAAVECLERNLPVVIAEDAVASNDLVHAAATRRWLADRSVRFESAAGVLGSLDGRPSSLVHRSPRNSDEILYAVRIAGSDEVAAATAAARTALDQWQAVSWDRRREALQRVAGRLRIAAFDLARQAALEIGKPLAHGIEEARRAADHIEDVIRRAGTPACRREPAGLVRQQPVGVVAIISPWNNPLAIPLSKLAPALAYGNTAVWKPAPAASRISELVLQWLIEAGIPRGAVQLLTGDSATARALAESEHVDAVTFTGSAAGGAAMQEICARRFIPLQAELSGNNASIVCDDADSREVAAQIAWGAFAFAGQRCTANRRVIVPETRFEELWNALHTAGEALVWGDPLESNTEIGPVISRDKCDEINAALAAAAADGSAHRVERLQLERAQEPWTRTGAYAQPALVACADPAAALVQEEMMAPVLVVQQARDFDHALALCNGVRHGLVASLFSHSPDYRKRFLQQARAGVLKFNSSTAGVDGTLPFGGWKASGIGPPEHGECDRFFYTRWQAVYGADGLTDVENP